MALKKNFHFVEKKIHVLERYHAINNHFLSLTFPVQRPFLIFFSGSIPFFRDKKYRVIDTVFWQRMQDGQKKGETRIWMSFINILKNLMKDERQAIVVKKSKKT